MATPTLALIPTGYKAGKLYSVLPESGVGDFTVVRATEATRVNEEGLIETMGANVPRLDYSGGGCPVLLTEGQSTNILTNSENGSTYTVFSATKTLDEVISPNGTLNSFTLEGNGNYNQILGETVSVTLPSAGVYTFSVFAKKGTNDFIQLFFNQFSGSSNGEAYFDLENGTTPSSFGKIENYGNGWYRCSVVGTVVGSDLSGKLGFRISYTSSNFFFPTANDANGKNAYFYGFQTEQQSYATSYIPTSGSAVTRNADQVYGAGDAATFNDSEGVLMAEISALNNTVSTYNSIGLGSGLASNRMGLGFEAPSNIYVYKRGDGGDWLPRKIVDITSLNKVALSYNTNDNHFWVNGFKIASNTIVGDAINLTELEFEASYGLEEFYGKTSQVQYFNTVLTDSELETLTSWTSFIEMAQAQNYNII